jgi:prefoldin subunit 5
LAGTEENQELADELAHLLRQREVLRQQVELIHEASERVRDEIELLKARARAVGVDLGDRSE